MPFVFSPKQREILSVHLHTDGENFPLLPIVTIVHLRQFFIAQSFAGMRSFSVILVHPFFFTFPFSAFLFRAIIQNYSNYT